MPKNNVTKPITDQEIAFARLVLAGTMNDRRAAEAAGLNPNSAPYTKSKPRVRAYMLEHRAAVQQQLVEQDTGELRRFSVSRDQVLTRLWEIANMEPERTAILTEALSPPRTNPLRPFSRHSMSPHGRVPSSRKNPSRPRPPPRRKPSRSPNPPPVRPMARLLLLPTKLPWNCHRPDR